ncbi:MAG: flagellar hook-associated protein FlgK [Pseudomonadota bacterium]
MANGIFSIGITGLNAAKIGLDITGNNIANVNTPGYSRQEILQSPTTGQNLGSGYIGQGTQVDTVARQYNSFLQNQVVLNQSQQSYYESYSAQITQIDDLLNDSSTGISPAMQKFFSSMQDLANSPMSGSTRQTVVSSSESLVESFKSLDGQLKNIETGVNTQINQSLNDINGLSSKIADLNQKIQSAGSYTNQQPNSFLDQRDEAMKSLNKLIQASGTVQADGSLDVYIGTGQSLVVGNRAETLVAVKDSADPSQLNVAVKNSTGSTVLQASSLAGGSLGGLLAFRDESLNSTRNQLGKLAVGFATTVNAQQSLGTDLKGALGTNMFAVGNTNVLANANNTGSGTVSAAITDVKQLTTSDYELSVQGGQYQVKRLSDNVTQTFGTLPQTVDGVAINVTGTPAEGDRFVVQPTRLQAFGLSMNISDGSKIAAASPILTQQASTNTGNASISAGSVVNNTNGLPLAAPISLTYDATAGAFNVTGDATPTTVSYVTGSTVTLNGNLQFNITGTPKNGDQFTISANTNGVSDNRNALALGQLQTTKIFDNSTSSYQENYAQLVSAVGSQTRLVDASAQSQTSLLNASEAAAQGVSGVNLDEEAARLLQYQQAYQASGKLLQIASQLFDTILQLGR